jgi:hypothetical protein
MTTITPQVDGAQSAGQAAATVTPAISQPQVTTQQPAQPAPAQEAVRPHGISDAEYARQLREESLKRKGKIKSLKSEVAKTAAELAQTQKERDALKAQATAVEAKFHQLNTRRSEDLLVARLKGAGLSEAAARLLVPSLKGHVVVDEKSYEITLNDAEIDKAVAEIKPPQPPPPANGAQRLHQLNAAARTEPVQTQPLSWRDKLRQEADAIQNRK